MANPVNQKVLDKMKKRLSYGLDPDNLSTSKSASLSLKVSFMAYCAAKHGVDLPEEDLIDISCEILNHEKSYYTQNYCMRYIQWMHDNIDGMTEDPAIPKQRRNMLFQMELEYAKKVSKVVAERIKKDRAPILEAIRREKKRIQHRVDYIKYRERILEERGVVPMDDEKFMTEVEMILLKGGNFVGISRHPLWKSYTVTLAAYHFKKRYECINIREIIKAVADNMRGVSSSNDNISKLVLFYATMEKHIRAVTPPMPDIGDKSLVAIDNTLKPIGEEIEEIVKSGDFLTFTRHRVLLKKAVDEIKSAVDRAVTERKKHKTAGLSKQEKKKKYNAEYNKRKGKMTMEEYRQHQREQHIITLERKREESKKEKEERLRFKQSNPEIVVHKVKLEVNNKVRDYLIKCFGVARFCYNWALEEWLSARERGERIFTNELLIRFNETAMAKYPFTYGVNSWAKKTGFERFEYALDHFFKTGDMPQRKRRKLGLGSYHYPVGKNRKKHPILMDYNPEVPGSQPSKKRQYLYIPSVGYAKMMERLRFDGMLTSVTIKLESDGHFYACLQVYINQEEWLAKHNVSDKPIEGPIGIDLGVKDFAILSNGMKLNDSRKDKQLYQRKRYLQKVIKRCELKSKRRKELKWKLANTRAKMGDRYCDFLHKVTSAIAYNCSHVAMEHLNIHTMLQGGRASGRIQEAAFYKTRMLMEQKMVLAGHTLHIADKFFPSTRTCSVCGCIGPKLKLEQRTFHCDDCGAEMDRDLNAAINLAKLLGLGKPYKPADSLRLSAVLQKNGISVSETEAGKQVEPWI